MALLSALRVDTQFVLCYYCVGKFFMKWGIAMKRRIVIFAFALLLALGCVQAALAGYILEDSDSRYLSMDELRAYDLDTLGYIRNEILARYGYPFKTEKYREYFQSQSWYVRDENFDYNWLSSLEMENVERIKEVEEEKRLYGDDYYYEDEYYYDDEYYYGDEYIIADSDVRLLTKSELRAYDLDTLGYIRNEILARYGYPFETKKYREYFESQSWYVRDENFEYDWLSSTEMKNVELIKQIEKEKG